MNSQSLAYMIGMDWVPDEEIDSMLWHLAIQNAIEYSGNGNSGSVIGRVMSIRQDLRQYGKILAPIIGLKVEQANSLATKNGLEFLREILKREAPEFLQNREKKTRREGLPELKNAVKGNVVLRFAPNPNGPLSFGHARGLIINGEYAKQYDGEVILRFDDTDTTVKPPLKEAYEIIEHEAEWLLGFKPHRVVTASDRIEKYYDYVGLMLDKECGYVCQCSGDEFRVYRNTRTNCPCRDNSTEKNFALWRDMLTGIFTPGDAVVRVKTDMTLKNPALRDWPALRIQDTMTNPHPRDEISSNYSVWPLLDFQSAIEDYLQGVTHIIRGKDLMDSTRKQILLYQHFGWKYPETMYWGRVKVHEWGGFSTSKMRKDIESGRYNDWDDPRLPTIAALRNRGISAEALRAFWLELGVTQKDIAVPLSTLYSHNTRTIDDIAPRISFIRDPTLMNIEGLSIDSIEIPTHPNLPEMGSRKISLKSRAVYLEMDDLESEQLRLKEFADFDITDNIAIFVSNQRSDSRKIVHWASLDSSSKAELLMVINDEIVTIPGVLENHTLDVGTHVQLERIGYGIIAENNQIIFTHD